ncbi:MAG: alpha-galactosidase [Coriobacteriales bacterium]|nr:alpha-galactosidase [Coriobacteriales bacterium]
MSVGPSIRIAYHLSGQDVPLEAFVSGAGVLAGDADALGLMVSGDECVRRVALCPTEALVVDKIEATMSLALADADAIYLNGYNSWTDSVERSVHDRMWGLTRVPRKVVDDYVLDASGDYRFVAEDARRGHMHGFGYGYLRQADKVLLFGSLDEDSGFTLIREDADAGTLSFEKEPPAGELAAGVRREILSLALSSGAVGEACEEWLSLAGVKARPARPLVGYTSWYRHYGEIDFWKLERDLEGAARVLGELSLEGLDPVFQIDDGYAKVGDWLEYDRARFPEGLAPLATRAREQGLLPGLWLAPFTCERNSRLFCEHEDWLMRDECGELVTTGSQWSGGYALDVRKDEVRDYVREVLRTVTREWGFGLLKLDFLYSACLVPHDGLNRGELMADALDLLREAVGEKVRLLLCGVPLTSAFGRCEYCRVGCDVGLDWDDLPHMRGLHRERVSTKWSLANARGRAHLDGRVFRCDPDVLFLREEGVSFTPEQRMEMLDTDTSCGGVLFTSDDMGRWDSSQREAFAEAVKLFVEANRAKGLM